MIRPYWICDCDRAMAALPMVPMTRGISMPDNILWTPGQRIGVAFSGGSYGLRAAVAAIVDEWQANVVWDWGVDWNDAQIRLSFVGEGSWSLLGNIAELLPITRGETMRLGWAQWAFDNDYVMSLRAVVLHEFGHALGLHHEHLHPENDIDWDLAAMRNYYVVELGWTWEDVEKTWLTVLDASMHTVFAYDPKSVLHYPVESRFIHSGEPVPFIWNLSVGDLSSMRSMYGARDDGPDRYTVYAPVA